MNQVDKRIQWFALGAIALLVLGIGSPAWAEEAASQTPPTEAAQETKAEFVPVTFAGMQVFVDAETGKLRPPSEQEAQELARRMMDRVREDKAHSYQPLVQKNGTMSVVLGTDGMKYTVAVVQEDGSLAMDCVSSEDHAHEIVAEGTLGEAREDR